VALVGGVREERLTQLCVEFYSPPFLLLFVFLFRVHAEFEPDDVDVSQTALLLFALFLRKYERPNRGA